MGVCAADKVDPKAIVDTHNKLKSHYLKCPQDLLDAQVDIAFLVADDVRVARGIAVRIVRSLKSLAPPPLPLPLLPPQPVAVPQSPAGVQSKPSYFCGRLPIHVAEASPLSTGIMCGHVETTDEMSREKTKKRVVIKLGGSARDLSREQRILTTLNRANPCFAVKLFHAACDDEYLVLDRYDHDLRYVMHPDVSVHVRWLLVTELLDAVAFLHRQHVVHCDLKPANVLLKQRQRAGFQLKLCEFDSAVLLSSSEGEAFANDGKSLKWSPGWVCPEVYNGAAGVLQASPQMDLFNMGLMIAVMLLPDCYTYSTALPLDKAELDELFNPKPSLNYDLELFRNKWLRCSGRSHAALVYQLCDFDPGKRGSIACAQKKWAVLNDRTGYQTKLHEEARRSDFMEKSVLKGIHDTKKEVIGLRNDLVNMHNEVIAKLVETSKSVLSELTHSMLVLSKQEQEHADQQFLVLHQGVGEELTSVRALLQTQSKQSLGAADLENLSQSLMESFEQCSTEMNSNTRQHVTSVCEEMQRSLHTALSSDQQASHAEIVGMLTTYQGQLEMLQLSSQQVLDCVQGVRDHQHEVVDITRDLLLDGQAGILQAVADFSKELSAISVHDTTEFVAEMQKLSERDSRLDLFVDNLTGILEDMQSSYDGNDASAEFQAQTLAMMSQMGTQLSHITREVEDVRGKVNALPDKISTDVGLLMAAHSAPLLESMQDIHDKLDTSLTGIDKARTSGQLSSVIKSVQEELKGWLTTTITEVSDKSSEAVVEAIHTQHKVTTQALTALREQHVKSQAGDRQAVKESKAEVKELLTEMKTSLSQVLKSVSSCEQLCQTIATNVISLAAEGAVNAEETRSLLSALQEATVDAKKVLACPGNDDACTSKVILAALGDLQARFDEQLGQHQQHVATEVSNAISVALAEVRQQQMDSDDSSRVAVAATQQKLDVVLEALRESHDQLNALTAMSAAQKELLDIVEKRGNLLPRKFVILPDAPLDKKSSSVFQSMKKKMSRSLWTKVRLFFVCDESNQCAMQGGPKQEGYTIKIPTATLKVLVPVLVGSVAVLKVVLQMHGVPAGLVPNVSDWPGDSYLQAIMSHLPSVDDVVDELVVESESLKRTEAQYSAVQEGHVDELFRLVQQSEGCKEGHPLTGWEPRFTGLVKASGNRWVLPEHATVTAAS